MGFYNNSIHGRLSLLSAELRAAGSLAQACIVEAALSEISRLEALLTTQPTQELPAVNPAPITVTGSDGVQYIISGSSATDE